MPEIKLTIINNGEANIDTREAPLSDPTKIHRIIWSIICKLPATTIANNTKTASNKPSILNCQQHLRGK